MYKNKEAGTLIQHDDGSFTFSYNDLWVSDVTKPGISLTLPKKQKEYHSDYLFPFFYNMLPEGSNKQLVCKYHRIDNADDFGLLLTTANEDTIGAVRIEKISEK